MIYHRQVMQRVVAQWLVSRIARQYVLVASGIEWRGEPVCHSIYSESSRSKVSRLG
jgi:hypothetical protein